GRTRKIAPPEGGQFTFDQDRLAAINYRPVVIPVAITVVIFLDYHSVLIAMFVAIADDCTVVISIAVAVMPSADCYTNRSDTNSNLSRARRHRSTNARNRRHYRNVSQIVLLTL